MTVLCCLDQSQNAVIGFCHNKIGFGRRERVNWQSVNVWFNQGQENIRIDVKKNTKTSFFIFFVTFALGLLYGLSTAPHGIDWYHKCKRDVLVVVVVLKDIKCCWLLHWFKLDRQCGSDAEAFTQHLQTFLSTVMKSLDGVGKEMLHMILYCRHLFFYI